MHKIFGLRPYVQIGVWLVAAALAITVALGVLAAAHAFDWLPERTTGNGFIEDLRQRVASALAEYRQGKIDDGQYLCALIGISGVREGLNLQVLTAEARGDWRFLGVAGAGLGIESVETYANLVSDTALRPDVAVVGFTPSQLLDTILFDNISGFAAKAEEKRGVTASIIETVKSWIWLPKRRTDIRFFAEDILKSVRAAVFRAFKLEIATADPQSPWRPMIRLMGAEHYSQESLKERLWVIEATGDFDWNAYVTSVRAPAILSRIVRRFHDAGTHVVVVLMPEHSWVVAREPVGGAEHIRKTLLARVGEEGVQFIDYRRAVDDSGFVDLVHLNTAGSRQFSRILAGEIRRIALMHPPLMNGAAGARPAASRGRAPTDGMVR